MTLWRRVLDFMLPVAFGLFCAAVVELAGGPYWAGIMTVLLAIPIIRGLDR